MRKTQAWTTHIPMLIKAVQMTDGPVMELGAGMFSTPLLHWLCYENNRKLATYEINDRYAKFAKGFSSKNHQIFHVSDYGEIDTETHWDVVLVDHSTDERAKDIIRLKDKANYIVIHDTHSNAYGYDKIWKHFKYIHHWKFTKPFTSVVSNFKNLEEYENIENISKT